jgi:hypothetical protein
MTDIQSSLDLPPLTRKQWLAAEGRLRDMLARWRDADRVMLALFGPCPR